MAVFAASGAPIPLYERYSNAADLTTLDLSIAAVAYFAAVMIALVVLGGISDRYGRQRVSVTAVLFALAGCLALLHVDGLPVLIIGRVLHGIACGLGSSAIATYIIDLAPDRPRWLSAATAAGAPLIGLTIGALSSGAVAEYGPAPEQTTYLALCAVLAGCVLLLAASPAPAGHRAGPLAAVLRPRIAIPASARPLLPAAVAVFGVTWALGGFYQAFSPTIAARYLGTDNTLVAGIVFASFMAPYAFGGPIIARLAPATAQRGGILIFALAAAGIVAGLWTGTVITVIGCSMLAGAAQGAAFTGSLSRLLGRTLPAERAGLMSAVYLISYGGAAIPSLISGRLSTTLDLTHIALGHVALAILAIVMITTRPRRHDHQAETTPPRPDAGPEPRPGR